MSRRYGSLHENGTPALIVDVLSTEGRWLRYSALVDCVQRIDPSRTEMAIQRAIERLKERGRIKSRPLGEGGWLEYYSDEWSPGGS